MKELADVPTTAQRLFAHYERTALGADVQPFLIGRLLEEGDGSDLRWLAQAVGEDALASWVATTASRQLSRRSRAFWATVLDLEVPIDQGGALWPL